MKRLILHLFCWFTTAASFAQRPNIVLIVSDDHAYQTISAYGSKLMQTPHIDRIAKEGVLFEKAYVTNSICGPSRAVILTGKYSHKNGFRDNENSKFDAYCDENGHQHNIKTYRYFNNNFVRVYYDDLL